MTQANNRQGQGGGELVPFIEGGAAPRLDRVARWGGTESNRARAARGGFTFAMPSDPGTVIARLDTTGPEPVGSVSRDGGRTWEDAPRWPATPGALPGVVVMSAWRRPDGALVAEGSDGVDRVTKPGEIRTPEDADRLFGVGFGLGRWMRENASAAVFDVLPAPQPAPAPGQVWLPPPGEQPTGWLAPDGTLTVEAVSDDGQEVRFAPVDAGRSATYVHAPTMARWTCLGVATPHGRVMVGDGFRASSGIQVEVTGVGPGDLLVRGSQEPTRERFTPGHAEAATLLGWTRTRYAPARAGERLRWRASGRPDEVIDAETAGCVADPAQWERLGGGHSATQTLASDLSAHEIIMDWIVSAEGIGHANGGVFTDCGRDGLTAIGLAAPAPDLRALFDAIGRALELPATRHACPFGAGLTVTVLRDEMLFTPTAETGIGTADLAGDARGLCALRSVVGEAMRNGAARLTQWGAKGPRVEVRREGGAMVAAPASEPAEPVRYQPSEDGADAWRWGGDGQ